MYLSNVSTTLRSRDNGDDVSFLMMEARRTGTSIVRDP